MPNFKTLWVDEVSFSKTSVARPLYLRETKKSLIYCITFD